MVGAGVGGAQGGFEAVGGGLVGEAGLLHLLGSGGGGQFRVEVVGGLLERAWRAPRELGVGGGDALRDLADGIGRDGFRCLAADGLGRAGRLWKCLSRALGRGVGVGTGLAFGGELAAIGDDEWKRFLGHGQARFRRLGSRKMEGECCWSDGPALVLDAGVAIECVTTDVPEGELRRASLKIKLGHAGQLADGLVEGGGFEERGSGRGRMAGEEEAGEGSVQVAAGADALDDLLAEIAAFAEVEGAGGSADWRGLLGEVAVANIGAEERCAFGDAELVEGFGV